MSTETAADLIDAIYEAAFFPENWLSILDDMARMNGFHGTALFNASARGSRALASRSLDDITQKILAEGWMTRNTRAAHLINIQHDGFVDEARHFTEEECQRHPIIMDVFRPLGYGFGTSTVINVPSGDKIIFALEKKSVTGPVEASAIAFLDGIRPHLARAAMMSSRLEFERVRAAVETLAMTGLPSAVLGMDGKLMACNALMENFAQVQIGASDRLHFRHAPANDLLKSALLRSKEGIASKDYRSLSFPLPAHETKLPAVVHLVPVRGNARDIFTHAVFFVIITPVDRSLVPTAETIQGLFDLSPAEARVARLLAGGVDVNAAAAQIGVSRETVRSQVKSILTKSGLNRQADFIAAVASIRMIE